MTNLAFLHGSGQGGWVWDQAIAALAAQSGGSPRCLALDAPGCGRKRGRDTSKMAFDEISRELIADIEAAGMRDVVLVGHSQAGMHLPQIAEFAPGLFRKLIFVSSIMPLPGKSSYDQMGRSRHGEKDDEVGWPIDLESSSAEERWRVMFCNDMSPAQADGFMAKLGKDAWPPICYIYSNWKTDHLARMPVTYVHCLQDMAFPPPWQEKFAERLHTDRHVRLDAGHQAMNTQPQALAEILLVEAAI